MTQPIFINTAGMAVHGREKLTLRRLHCLAMGKSTTYKP